MQKQKLPLLEPNVKMTEKHGRVISAATDGACSGNPGPGGWGALIRFEDGTIEEFGGYEPKTTNNRMELQAVLAIFKYLKKLPLHPQLSIRTDSKYLINGLCDWISKWKKNGWRTTSGKPVLNQDLWKLLDEARLDNVAIVFVKGHSGDKDNDRVDEIAVNYSKGNYIELKSNKKTHAIEEPCKPSINKLQEVSEPAPKNLQRLLSRLDMANHIAKHGYSLSLLELSDLLEMSTTELSRKTHPWQWRDWLVEPAGNSKGRFKLIKPQQSMPKEK